MKRGLIVFCMTWAAVTPLDAQRLSSLALHAGIVDEVNVEPTAAFAGSAAFAWGWPWLLMLQTSVADLTRDGTVGTQRNLSLSLLVRSNLLGDRIIIATGASLHRVRTDFVNASDQRELRVDNTVLLGLKLPVAGPALDFELMYRADNRLFRSGNFRHGGLVGIRYKPGLPNRLVRGEPQPENISAERAAVWNDVLMQLILLEQGLESFTRIREIETGIELEFDQRVVTLYDDVAKVARVLAAAEPPVRLAVIAPNATRIAAAATAGSFPAERITLQRDSRVFLRVER